MVERGHFQRLRALVAALARAGAIVHVFTDAQYRAAAAQDGAIFHDLFAGRSLAALDDDSFPLPCRSVTFAAVHADAICAEVRAMGAALIVHDAFALIGRVVAQRLRLPRVNVYAGHNVLPAAYVPALECEPRARIAPACRRAVQRLRAEYGIADASPFSYVGTPSADLNIACEPEAFFTPEERRVLEPVAFFGSLHTIDAAATSAGTPSLDASSRWPPSAPPHALRIYASFGTIVWRWYPEHALAALRALARAVAARDDVTLLVSLAGASVAAAARAELAAANVRVADFVDQWRVLQKADVFVTHCGLNSTHEAIFHGVPMLAYPFFWDQPALTDVCVRLGLAQRLVEGLRADLATRDVHAALAAVTARRVEMTGALQAACAFELAAMASRPEVVRRILALAGRPI